MFCPVRFMGVLWALSIPATLMAQSVPLVDASEVDTRPTRVAILLLATSGVDAELADSLTELLIATAAARGDLELIGKEEFQARLGQDEGRSLECIGSAACLGRVGVELSVDEVIAGTLGRSSDGWAYNLNCFDIRSGELVGRAFETTPSDVASLAASIRGGLEQLFTVVEPVASIRISTDVAGAEIFVDGSPVGSETDGPILLDELPVGTHQVVIRAPGYQVWSREVSLEEGDSLRLEVELVASAGGSASANANDIRQEPVRSRGVSRLLWVGLGIAVAGGVAASVYGVRAEQDPSAGLTRQEAIDEVEARRRDATVAHASLGVVGGGVALGLVGLLLSDFGDEEDRGDAADSGYSFRLSTSNAGVQYWGSW